jgi:hypothetical protein
MRQRWFEFRELSQVRVLQFGFDTSKPQPVVFLDGSRLKFLRASRLPARYPLNQ